MNVSRIYLWNFSNRNGQKFRGVDENIHQICFNVLFELSEAYTTRIPQKTVQKPLKTTEKAVAGTNILPQNPKSADIFPLPPPLCGNVENIQGCMHGCISNSSSVNVYDQILNHEDEFCIHYKQNLTEIKLRSGFYLCLIFISIYPLRVTSWT